MNSSDVLTLINPIMDDISNKRYLNADFYAFKSIKPEELTNNLVTLEYEFYNTNFDTKDIINIISDILYFFKKKYIDNSETSFELYNINNSSSLVDYLQLQNLDFSKDDIKNGTNLNIDPNSYKIEYLLNSMYSCSQYAASKKDYRKLKYSALTLTTDNNDSIVLINKSTPLFKSRNRLYTFDYFEDQINHLTPITDQIIKLPYWPHIVIINNYCFLIQENIEAIFGFEQFNKLQKDNAINYMHNKLPFSENSFSHITSYANNGKNYNMFANFDDKYIQKIKDKDPETLHLLSTVAEININDNQIEISSKEDAIRFLAFVCGYIKQDVFTKKYVISYKTIDMPK